MSKKIQEDIIQAIDLLTNNKIQKLNLDKTVQATIIEPINLKIGEYLVEYETGKFSAYSNDLNKVYHKGDKVFIKVPENNFNNKKIIENLINSNNNINIKKNIINKVGASWEKIYPTLEQNIKFINSNENFGLIAGGEQKNLLIYDRDQEIDKTKLVISDDIFLNYSKRYDKIQIKADFFTAIDILKSGQGKYGLELVFISRKLDNNLKDNGFKETEVTYRFDNNNFIGNPYKFNLYSPQSMIIDVEKGYLLKLKSIKLFQEGFNSDFLNKNKNILLKNLSISFCEEIDLSQSGFYCYISTPNGIDIVDDKPIKLIGELLYNGENVINNNTQINWFKRDPEISLKDTQYYDEEIGEGWKKINNPNNFLLIYNNENQEKDTEKIEYLDEYLVKINYNKNIYTSQIIVKNNKSIYDLYIEQNNDEQNQKDIYLSIISKKINKNYLGKWFYQYNNGSIIEIENRKKLNKIKINSYLKCNQVTFYCKVYDNDKEICCITKKINRIKEEKDFNIDFLGTDSYNYNADGDMPLENSEKFQKIIPKIEQREGYASAFKIDWIIGKEIISNDLYNNPQNTYNPKNSMMNNIYIDSEGNFNYKIKQKYNTYYTNNILTLKITTVNNKEYKFKKEILFIKTGDQGSNGTKYISAVRPIDEDKNKLLGFQPLILENNGGSQLIKNFIYKDGKPIFNDDQNYEIKYIWESETYEDSNKNKNSIFNIIPIEKDSSIVEIELSGNLHSALFADTGVLTNKEIKEKLIVKCKVEIINKDVNEINKKTILYYNYPVNILIKKNNEFNLEDIEINIPNYIKYNTNGINATYETSKIKLLYKNQDYINTLVSGDKELVNIKQVEDIEGHNFNQLVPAASFNYSKGITYFQGEIDGNLLIYPIMMFLDTFGNEAINGWDGTSISIENKSGGRKKGSLLAPQVGAGIKSPEGKFTGVVMGEDTTQKEIGLYGYSEGVNNFGLMANGKAYFGQSVETGRIDFDGTSGIIQGGGGGNQNTGMSIRLASFKKDTDGSPLIDTTTGKIVQDEKIKAIQVANNNFYVTYGGLIHSIAGEIGGWILKEDGLYSPDTIFPPENSDKEPHGAIMLQSQKIDSQGNKIKEAKATIEKGLIGGWVISKEGIYSPDTVFKEDETTTLVDRGSIMLISEREIEVYDKKAQETEKIEGPIAIIDRGEIGKWVVTDELIHSNPKSEENVARTILDSKKSTITTQTFNITKRSSDNKNDEEVGHMGMIEGLEGTTNTTTYNLGLETNQENKSIILDSKKASIRMNAEQNFYINSKITAQINSGENININSNNIKLSSNNIKMSSVKDNKEIAFVSVEDKLIQLRGGGINIGTGGGAIIIGEKNYGTLSCNIKPENQFGIYARFA